MDQTLSPPHQPALQASGAAHASEAASPDEDPESPGRSSHQVSSRAVGSDPLAEGMALMVGTLLALTSLLVPLATVVFDRLPPASVETTRAGS